MLPALDRERAQLREEAKHAGGPLGSVDGNMADMFPPAIHLEDPGLLSKRRPPGVSPRVPQPIPLGPVGIVPDCIAETGAELGSVEVVQIRPQVAKPRHGLQPAGAKLKDGDPVRQHVEDVLRGARVLSDVYLGELQMADQRDGALRHTQGSVELVELSFEDVLRDVRLREPI